MCGKIQYLWLHCNETKAMYQTNGFRSCISLALTTQKIKLNDVWGDKVYLANQVGQEEDINQKLVQIKYLKHVPAILFSYVPCIITT